MLSALWYMIKLGLVLALAVWVAEQSGDVVINWREYRFTIDLGVFLLIALLLILVSIFVYNFINGLVNMPSTLRRYQSHRLHNKGYDALTRGLTAVAAGDTRKASEAAQKVEKYLPDGEALPLLLQAQAARMRGDDAQALEHFARLMEHKEAGFLGVRGLLQAALDSGRDDKALELARYALSLHPKQPWILKLVYDLEVEQRLWSAAETTLLQASKYGAIDVHKAASDRVALLMAQAEAALTRNQDKAALDFVKQANRLDPAFTPAAVKLADLYQHMGKRRSAIKVIEKIWPEAPHPELAEKWLELAPVARSSKKTSARQMDWARQLVQMNKDSIYSYLAAARMAMRQHLWGEARSFLDQAEALSPVAGIFEMRAELERQAGAEKNHILQWFEKESAAIPDHVWMCCDTGRIYKNWAPVAHPHGAFNTIKWRNPADFEEHYLSAGSPGQIEARALL